LRGVSKPADRSPCCSLFVATAADGIVGATWQIAGVKVLRSALKHGCAPADIEHALRSAVERYVLSDDPFKWLYIGLDGAGRALEIVSVLGDDGEEVVIHAMRLRKRSFPGGGRR